MSNRAIIIGAGIAGLSAGIALRDAGWSVAVYEQAPKLEAMGAALSIWPNAVAALDQLGCGDAFRKVAPELELIQLARSNGTSIFANLISDVLPGQRGYLPSRTDLQNVLAQRLGGDCLHLGHQLANWRTDERGVEVGFENGHIAHGDLLIAADGIWSRIAGDVLGSSGKHTGYGGVLALSDPVASVPNQAMGTEYWSSGARFGLFDHVGNRKYWFYMRNEPDGPSAKDVKLDDVRRAVAGWDAPILATIDATPEAGLIPFSIHAKPPPKKLGQGRVICVGDAGHAMEPNMGQGGCQALEDAVALGIAARDQDAPAILKRFERMRLKRVRSFVKLSAQGGLVSHRFPALIPLLATRGVSALFGAGARRQLPNLYQMPDYAKMV
jgi:2-polyprenyl-6-methoxyphenol hydroxylase-like FAD-dependent oxidoreductase